MACWILEFSENKIKLYRWECHKMNFMDENEKNVKLYRGKV